MRGSLPNKQQIMAELLEESAANKKYQPAAYHPEDGLPIMQEQDSEPEYPQVAVWGDKNNNWVPNDFFKPKYKSEELALQAARKGILDVEEPVADSVYFLRDKNGPGLKPSKYIGGQGVTPQYSYVVEDDGFLGLGEPGFYHSRPEPVLSRNAPRGATALLIGIGYDPKRDAQSVPEVTERHRQMLRDRGLKKGYFVLHGDQMIEFGPDD